jgi:hypothetical protein
MQHQSATEITPGPRRANNFSGAPESWRPAVVSGFSAVHGAGDLFHINSATGSGTFTYPVPTSPGRDGLAPSLSLNYNSGYGNGPFGLGWDLDVPQIFRRTNVEVPKYDDTIHEDVFAHSSLGELVPKLKITQGQQPTRGKFAQQVVGDVEYIELCPASLALLFALRGDEISSRRTSAGDLSRETT